ncbi:Flp family type IVb pilin [Planctomicrobium sp. SH527]|uniref:Flp family type IVb pilin n=1 Tax=Planctomicrobium sp. SH527 TaxID=3448123 RepID=UPI003F5BD364
MSLFASFLNDESGAVLSAETALLGTMAVAGATVGLSTVSTAVQDELAEVAYSFRSLDQSYSFEGRRSGSAWTAGSSFIQRPAAESITDLQKEYERKKSEAATSERGSDAAESAEQDDQR